VAFVPTTSGDADAYIVRFYTAFSRLSCRPSHLALFRRTPDMRSYLLAQDVIYVGGGNTKSMLAVWREWGLPELLREAWASSIVLAGISAGAICWFEQGVTDSVAGQLRALDGLGSLDFIEQHDAQELADARDRTSPVEPLGGGLASQPPGRLCWLRGHDLKEEDRQWLSHPLRCCSGWQ
jgi:peptidase E